MSDEPVRSWDPWRWIGVRLPDGSSTAALVWLPPLPARRAAVPQQSAAPAVEQRRLATR